MINKWLNTKRNKSVNKQLKRGNKKRKFGQFEQLEDKRCLAFLGFFDGVTLEIEQTTDDGDVLIENVNDVWRATDNAGTFTFVNAENVSIELLPNTVNQLSVQVATAHEGDLTLLLNDGAREVLFIDPALNEIGGNLDIRGGMDNQIINLTTPDSFGLIVHGTTEIHLGTGVDTVTNPDAQFIQFDGDVSLSGVNQFDYNFQIGIPFVQVSDLTIDTTVEDEVFTMTPTGAGAITGDFNFTGGINIDRIDFVGLVEGDVNVDLGEGVPFFGDPQLFQTNATFLGDLNIAAGDSNLGNDIILGGVFAGNIVSYTGGDLVDNVEYSLDGAQADVFIVLGADNDTFTLNTPVNDLSIDFGNDAGDQFINNLPEIDFEVDLLNFHFFNHIYTAVNDRLVLTQLADTGDVTIDNDGGLSGFDWQITTGLTGQNSSIGAENLVVNLISNTGNNLIMDLINPVIASIELNVGDGDRQISFVGISNNPLRDIDITADAGEQIVDLAVNHPLGVATLNIDLGTGFDVVNDNDMPLVVDEDLRFTGVNLFEHDGLVSVFRDAVIDTTGEIEDSVFAINGSLSVGSSFTYLGGDGADVVQLNGPGGARITQETFIDIGDAVTGTDQAVLVDSANSEFGRSFTLLSSNSTSVDSFASDADAQFMGDLLVDLAGGTNNASLVGVFTGNSVDYIGGSGVDTLTYGMSGNPADLNILLGDGDDHVDLLAGSSIASPLVIDFGAGDNTFNNLFGPLNFDAFLSGLQGFDHTFIFATNTLTSTQVEDLGDVVFNNQNAAGSFSVTAGGSTSLIGSAGNLTINLLDGSSSLDVVLDNSLAGNLVTNLGNGDRILTLSGIDNSIGGNLAITAEVGQQIIAANTLNALTVTGDASINLGTGDDDFQTGDQSVSIGGNTELIGVNRLVSNQTMMFGGDLLFDVSGETQASQFMDRMPITIGGDFTYLGNSADDSIMFAGASEIGGNIAIAAGDGDNTANLANILGGDSVSYSGGIGVDLVNYGATGSAATLDISLGANDDVFTLSAGANIIGPLTIDFGTGADTFINDRGIFDFDAELNGLNGFNHIFTFATSTLNSTQVEDLGDVVIDNLGLDSSFQFLAGGSTSTLTPADNLILTMLDGSASDVTLNLDNVHNGDLIADLANGTRTVTIGGSVGEIGGVLEVTGGDDAQTVEVDAIVGGDIRIDLGEGDNVANLLGVSNGNVDFTSGAGNDTFTYDMSGVASVLTANMGGGDDTFHLMASSVIGGLFVDFATGNDTFINDLGPLNFPTNLLGLGGFDHSYDPVAGTLTSVQTDANGGPVTFDNNGDGNAVRVTADSVSEFGPISNLVVTLLDNSLDTLNFDFDNPLAGNLTADVGDGNRIINFTGSDNSIGGVLDLSGGDGMQTVNIAVSNGLSVAGDAIIDLGTGNDALDANGNNVSVAGSALLLNANRIALDGSTSIGGDLTVDNSSEAINSRFDAAILDLAGQFDYLGGDGDDVITLTAPSTFGSDIDILAGAGNNSASLLGTLNGNSVDYTGGSGTDDVILGTTGNDANFNVRLGAGNDSVVLNADTAVADSLRIDFGGGDDMFTSNFGQFDFNAQLLDLDGYDAFFDVASGNLDIIQESDTGNLVLDNNGLDSAIRFGNGALNTISPANDLRLILMDDTSTNLIADFDSVRNGITTIQLNDGDRNVTLTGSSNVFNGLLRFEAADGVQNVELAANADLTVNGTLIVNTRGGNDTVSAGNAIEVSNALLLRSVNNFVNNNGVDVGGDFNVITLLENQDTRLISNTSFEVGGNLSYLGGGGVDEISFKSTGATLGGFLYVDLATSNDLNATQRVILTGGFTAASVVVDGDTAAAGNVFNTDANTTIFGDVIVNFASSTTSNTAIFRGNYSTSTYGTYRGGSSSDFVVLAATGPNMVFAVLTGGGSDILTVEATTNVDFLFGDLGGGMDFVDNQFDGDFPFDNNIFNL